MKRILLIISRILGIALLIVLLGFVASEQGKSTVTGLNIKLDNKEEYTFITQNEILEVVQAGEDLVGMPFSDIDLPLLERKVRNMPEVLSAEVYRDLHGSLNIDVVQRKPLVRIFTRQGDSYYIDELGYFMPLSEYYTARVPVASGNIHITYPVGTSMGHIKAIMDNDSIAKRSMIDDVFILCKRLQEDEFWRAQTEQIFVNKDRELELIPKLGDHVILLGDASDLDKKLRKLMAMYKGGFATKGWDKYKTINLKFENQIVCTRK